MVQLDKLLNEHETKMNVTLEAKIYLFKFVKQNKETRKKAIKTK